MKFRTMCMAIYLIFFLSACLEERKTSSKESSSNMKSWFEGVKTVFNKGGLPAAAEISWSRADRTVVSYRVYSLLEDAVTHVTSWALLDEVSADQLKYTHSGLNSGQVYSYKVQAVDTSGNEDGNTVVKATVAFEGIGGVFITGTSTAQISLNSSTGAFDEIRVYAVPKYAVNTSVKGLPVATVRGHVGVINVTGLQSGTPYLFTVNAYMSNIASEDGNNFTMEGQTYSDSFGSGESADNIYTYQGFLNIQSFGLAPNAPLLPTSTEDPDFNTKFPNTLENPRNRLVRLTWLPFKNATSITKYKLVRAATTSTLSFNGIPLCSAGITDAACEVCTVSGAGPLTCEDHNVQLAPKAYHYAVTLVKPTLAATGEYAEELPKKNFNDFKVKVHISPDYMVLVQRNVANYEMCKLMNRASDPRRWQRCAYNGFGAKPFSSGPSKTALNLENGYYDQGYSFFVDRYRQACKWTNTPGHCGSPYGCVTVLYNGATNLNPDNAMGQDGDVLWGLTSNSGNAGRNCFLKKGGVWRSLDDTTNLTSADRAQMVTIDPGPDGAKMRPPAYPHSQMSAAYTCQAISTPYGPKRLLRHREYIVASAFPIMQGEPNVNQSYYEEGKIKNRSSLATDLRYECDIGTWAADNNYQAPPADLAAMMTSTTNERMQTVATNPNNHVSRYFIGTKQTIRCQSRYGIQNLVNSWEGIFFSDSLVRINATTSFPIQLRGVTSDYDSGNTDLVGFEFGTGTGSMWGNVNGYAHGPRYMTSNTLGEAWSVWGPKFILPLGLPTKNGVFPLQQDLWDVSALVDQGALGINGYQDSYAVYNTTGSRYVLRGRFGRFGVYLYPEGAIWSASNHCAVEAE